MLKSFIAITSLFQLVLGHKIDMFSPNQAVGALNRRSTVARPGYDVPFADGFAVPSMAAGQGDGGGSQPDTFQCSGKPFCSKARAVNLVVAEESYQRGHLGYICDDCQPVVSESEASVTFPLSLACGDSSYLAEELSFQIWFY